MSSYSGKINLLKMQNACIITVKGKSSSKRGVFIPIEDNHMFISADDDLKPKGAYVDFVAWENQQVSQYGDTHGIKMSIPKNVRERMSEDERKSVPYIGNMKPYESQSYSNNFDAPQATVEEDEDPLPF